MLINCKVNAGCNQIYLAAAGSTFDFYDDQYSADHFSLGKDCVFVVTDWEGIDKEISVTFQNFPPAQDCVLVGELTISSPTKIFELGEPDLPGDGIFFLSTNEKLNIKLFTDGKELPKSVVFFIENADFSVINYENLD